MLQIKTILKDNPDQFDQEVNAALQEGWTLNKRYLSEFGFVAEMSKETITEDEKCCENCKHENKEPNIEPCRFCNDADKWEHI